MINGLDVFPEFVNELRELELVKKCGKRHEDALLPSRHTVKGAERYRLERYGRAAGYADGVVSRHIPTYLDDLSLELEQNGIVDHKPNSVTINEYLPGNGLRPHIDKPEAGPEICILNLLSDAELFFELTGFSSQIVTFPRRSVLRMRGWARWQWSHGVLPMKNRRLSIVFRYASDPVPG